MKIQIKKRGQSRCITWDTIEWKNREIVAASMLEVCVTKYRPYVYK